MACLTGADHQLATIYEDGTDAEKAVVRWCRTCGSVVVDLDYDGRTNAGGLMEMKTPSLLTDRIQLHEKYAGHREVYDVVDTTGTLGTVYATRVAASRDVWSIERCNFMTKELAAKAAALLTRAGLLPRR